MTDFSFLELWFQFFTSDISLRLAQLGLISVASLLVFFVFFVTRDILLRTHSLAYQVLCILLAALLPILGFLLYLLIRPARTIKEREMYEILKKLAGSAATKSPVSSNSDFMQQEDAK